MFDVFDNINVDVAIADSNTLTYNLFAIPKKVQIVFKGLLEVTKYINAHTLARHVRICIHNEKMFVDMTDDTRGQIDNALTMLNTSKTTLHGVETPWSVKKFCNNNVTNRPSWF